MLVNIYNKTKKQNVLEMIGIATLFWYYINSTILEVENATLHKNALFAGEGDQVHRALYPDNGH